MVSGVSVSRYKVILYGAKDVKRRKGETETTARHKKQSEKLRHTAQERRKVQTDKINNKESSFNCGATGHR